MKNENYPISRIEHALKVSELVQREARKDSKTDLVATAYAIFNRLPQGGNLDHIAIDRKSDKMGDFSSTGSETPVEPCFKSLSIVAGVFAGLYEDPTNGATRFHRHDQCPGWAEKMQPCALLGPYLYYRD